MDLCIDKQT